MKGKDSPKMAITNYQLLNKESAPSPFNNVRYLFDKFRVSNPGPETG